MDPKNTQQGAPRVTVIDINANIVETEIVKHVTPTGKVLRWAVLTLRNGFAATGRPSCAASVENDNAETGETIAIANAKDMVWELMGYELHTKMTTPAGELPPAQAPVFPGFENLQPHQQRVVVESAELKEKIIKLEAFLGTDVYQGLSEDERDALKVQLQNMAAYRDILEYRIGKFTR